MRQELRDAQKRRPPTEYPNDLLRDRIVGTAEAARFAGFSTSHWRCLVKGGRVPPPIRLSERKLGWRISTLRAWIAEKEAAA
jgi:predicted DNA-binding transcriptional regulator AlpA